MTDHIGVAKRTDKKKHTKLSVHLSGTCPRTLVHASTTSEKRQTRVRLCACEGPPLQKWKASQKHKRTPTCRKRDAYFVEFALRCVAFALHLRQLVSHRLELTEQPFILRVGLLGGGGIVHTKPPLHSLPLLLGYCSSSPLQKRRSGANCCCLLFYIRGSLEGYTATATSMEVQYPGLCLTKKGDEDTPPIRFQKSHPLPPPPYHYYHHPYQSRGLSGNS